MVFSSLFFLYLFLPLNLILYFAVPKIRIKNFILLIFSLFFYAWGEPSFIFIMLFTAFLDYAHSNFIEKHRGTTAAKISLACAVITDISVLAVFKYLGFIMGNLNLLPFVDLPKVELGLPIGISFYTFQTLTYVVDVYRGKVSAQKNYFKYLLYITSYFQLVAGPIVRYEYFEHALDDRKTTLQGFRDGIMRFCIGLAKKVIIANSLGEICERYMGADVDLGNIPVLAAWVGMISFTLQLYFDFSGYSDMAIGLGKMFGFSFPENFNYPYISKSVSEFWRRWHMTLGSFFRDYVYIPLGGNRKRVYLNLAIVWMLTGLWHGASWNFVLWGVYNGLFIIIERLIRSARGTKSDDEKKRGGIIGGILSHIYLVACVNFGFALFYFTDMTRLGTFFASMFGFGSGVFAGKELLLDLSNNFILFILAIILCMPIYKKLERFTALLEKDSVLWVSVTGVVKTAFVAGVLVICSLMLVGNSFNPFIYFNF